MSSTKTGGKVDSFAQIAASRKDYVKETLVEINPPDFPDIALPVDKSDPTAAFRPMKKMKTAADLDRELAKQRKAYAKFLHNLAPVPDITRITVPLEEFDWHLQTENDPVDPDEINQWEQVKIPHYGGPIGRATAFYKTAFQVTDEMLAKGALFACFKGVDYKAHVFVNGIYIGSHEGFFAPFEFEFTRAVRVGENTLLIRVENDAITMSNDSWDTSGVQYEGDKIYAATGPGWDDPIVGWHHCPPGMGIYQDVFIEARSVVHVSDIFVRPILEESRAEGWIEIFSTPAKQQDVDIELSVYGQNFRNTVFEGQKFSPAKPMGPGINYLRLPFELPYPKVWDLAAPWLYQIQVKVLDKEGNLLDVHTRQFGMRAFKMDEDQEPKGKFYLNSREIRLRGANTMGFEQQAVMKKDWDRLIDDILLAKICNMNFWRLTQRPVQPEVYDYCDRLGLMTQTDLPTFACIRRSQFCEGIREAQEMEKLVRSHPCNIMVTYINEPFADGFDKPHRHLTRPELESFFRAADEAVRLVNPDRVIKPVDGDYDPPAPGLPDNHCYCGWYNGHGVDLGKLNKGYWQPVKPGWFYGCGEFGAEGLDRVEVMRKYYPKDWLPQTQEDEYNWSPNAIIRAQTGNFHYLWFETQHSVEDWVKASLAHQDWVTRLMSDAIRRDSRLNTCAIHLFIDAFPSGWMKTIMDCERHPKPAFFTYRDALTPLMVNLRADRSTYFSGDNMAFEAWICNDTNEAPEHLWLHYQLEVGGKVVFSKRTKASVPACSSEFQGNLVLPVPQIKRRSKVIVRLGLLDEKGAILHDSSLEIEVFPAQATKKMPRVHVIGAKDGKAAKLAAELELKPADSNRISQRDVLLIDDFSQFAKRRKSIEAAVERGAMALFVELPEGEYDLCESKIKVAHCGMGERHFASRGTGHKLVQGFETNDFRFWYNSDTDYVTPLLNDVFEADGWTPILASGNGAWQGDWGPALAAAEKPFGKGIFRICQVTLAGRLANPVARIFAERLISTR